MRAMAKSVFNMEREDDSSAGRWRIFALFFRLGMAQEVSEYLESEGIANVDTRFYTFHEAPTVQRQVNKDHILYQVCYGFKKAYGGHGNLIKVIMMRSSQLLNEECIAVLTQLQLGQIRAVVEFLEACIAPYGDAKDFVVAAV